jgi:hypothetical protein
MEKTLTREAKTQLASSLRRRYQAASSRAKKQILGEFVAVSGYHPKYAIHLLNAAEPSASERRGAGATYAVRRSGETSADCVVGSLRSGLREEAKAAFANPAAIT